jgi:hypothetical protein
VDSAILFVAIEQHGYFAAQLCYLQSTGESFHGRLGSLVGFLQQAFVDGGCGGIPTADHVQKLHVQMEY